MCSELQGPAQPEPPVAKSFRTKAQTQCYPKTMVRKNALAFQILSPFSTFCLTRKSSEIASPASLSIHKLPWGSHIHFAWKSVNLYFLSWCDYYNSLFSLWFGWQIVQPPNWSAKCLAVLSLEFYLPIILNFRVFSIHILLLLNWYLCAKSIFWYMIRVEQKLITVLLFGATWKYRDRK